MFTSGWIGTGWAAIVKGKQFLTPGLKQRIKGTVILLTSVLIPATIVGHFFGLERALPYGMAILYSMMFARVVSNLQAAAIITVGAVLAALSTVVGKDPLGAAALIFVAALLQGVTNYRATGVLTLAPAMVIFFGPGPIHLNWDEAALWVVAGGTTGVVISRLLRIHTPPVTVGQDISIKHGLVLGTLGAILIFVAMKGHWQHGYWAPLTLMMALRPVPGQRMSSLEGRLTGTMIGGVIALVTFRYLPHDALLVLGIVGLCLTVAFMQGRNYLLQALAMTPTLLVLVTLGDTGHATDFALQRIVFTALGVAVAVPGVYFLRWWDDQGPIKLPFLPPAPTQTDDPAEAEPKS